MVKLAPCLLGNHLFPLVEDVALSLPMFFHELSPDAALQLVRVGFERCRVLRLEDTGSSDEVQFRGFIQSMQALAANRDRILPNVESLALHWATDSIENTQTVHPSGIWTMPRLKSVELLNAPWRSVVTSSFLRSVPTVNLLRLRIEENDHGWSFQYPPTQDRLVSAVDPHWPIIMLEAPVNSSTELTSLELSTATCPHDVAPVLDHLLVLKRLAFRTKIKNHCDLILRYLSGHVQVRASADSTKAKVMILPRLDDLELSKVKYMTPVLLLVNTRALRRLVVETDERVSDAQDGLSTAALHRSVRFCRIGVAATGDDEEYCYSATGCRAYTHLEVESWDES